MKPNELSLVEAGALIASGELTSEALTSACLQRIAEREPAIQAWTFLDGEAALAEARASDNAGSRKALQGIPIAVKDVIDVAGMPTEMGSPIYKGYRPWADSGCVATLRAAGAIMLGKTVTAEFAGVFAGPTRNPLDLARTPGGSSSGSAAAVADRMVGVALATQTAGSTLRPASYCGLVGFKPSYNAISRTGLKLSAETLDTIGLIAREVGDIDLVWRTLVNRGPRREVQSDASPRLAFFRTHNWERASADVAKAVEDTVARLRQAGASVEEMPVPAGFSQLSEARRTINNYERARSLAWEFHHHRDAISAPLLQLLDDGWTIPHERYLDAIGIAASWRQWLVEAFKDYDALITAAAESEAPVGLSATGSPAFQEIWTMLHVPAITLPLAQGANEMPVGVQFVGRHNQDEALLETAAWVMRNVKG